LEERAERKKLVRLNRLRRNREQVSQAELDQAA